MEQPVSYRRQKAIEDEAALEAFKIELTGVGYVVIEPNKEGQYYPWFFFWKDGCMGYVAIDHFQGYNFSTAHRPSTDHGIGYDIEKGAELTLENAAKCLTHFPTLANRKNPPEFYTSPEDFINYKGNQWMKYQVFHMDSKSK